MAAPQQTFGEDDGKVEHDSFPSLESVLTSLNASCGFNIEVDMIQNLSFVLWNYYCWRRSNTDKP